MFTGLIEAVGVLAEVQVARSGRRVCIATALATDLDPGESLAVNGACLTVVTVTGDQVRVDVGPETIRASTAGAWRAGQRVNLERSMRVDGRFGGHVVLGHVDATGTIRQVRTDGDTLAMTIAFPLDLAPYVVEKGSVAVDGVSLTIAALRAEEFDVMIVPFTRQHTAFSGAQPGDGVNLECDMIGKYVVRALELATARTR